MLASLHIENIALLKKLDLELADGFCAFTGETGAGKSILIDSIGLLCGARGDKELIRSGETEALVEGVFFPTGSSVLQALQELGVSPDEDGSLFLQRKLNADGRSSAKINGRMIPLSLLREAASLLLNIHGQQDTQSLATEAKQCRLLDAFAESAPYLEAYAQTYRAFTDCKHKLKEEAEKAALLAERKDLLQYQQTELKAAKIRPGEEAELLAEHTVLANREKIAENASEVYEALYGGESSAAAQVNRAASAMRRLVGILPDGEELKARLEDASAELTDIADSLRAYAEPGEDPGDRLSKLETRLDRLSALKRKYKTDEQGLAELLASLQQALQTLEHQDETQKELQEQADRLQSVLQERAKALHDVRLEASKRLSERIQSSLAELDMPNVSFLIRVQEGEYGPTGADSIDFSVSANAGEAPKPIGKIASGGELSRIMLCLQCVLADVAETETLVFDEIDTGISGKTNEKIGRMMKQIACGGKTQVICVTHAAQLAGRATNQYRISKHEQNGRTETEVTLLDTEGRIEELARIMGGVQVTDTVRQAAKELLA